MHQATGMIVAQLGVTAREAYLGCRVSRLHAGVCSSDVAHAIVDRRLRFDPDPEAGSEGGGASTVKVPEEVGSRGMPWENWPEGREMRWIAMSV